ncbi:MAG: mechanosensitive ion channel family protein [Gammaproteobacteria bacterium]|nr:mechanosensitive ion channel family protein [Gammaproteobacteria bacterium]
MNQDIQTGQAILDLIARHFPATADYPGLVGLTVLVLVMGVSLGLFPLARHYVVGLVHRFVQLSQSNWAAKLMSAGFFRRAAWIVPPLAFYQGLRIVPALPAAVSEFLGRVTLAIIAIVVVRAFSAALKATNAIYTSYPMARNRPINSYLQILNIIAHLFAVIVMIAVLIGQSPWLFVSGLGAAMAIILLVFRDTLLSLVAGIQLTTNNLIQLGDWIEMPQFGADGDVVDISLHAIRVCNWDKTITVIPTHKFLDNAFKNWRGMWEAGGRRIKRAFNVDMSSIRFLTEEEIERFSRFALLHDYMDAKKKELEEHNHKHSSDGRLIANARRLTNVGTLRAYIINYLRQHPKVHQGMTLLVRQLQPTPQGLPIEIYVFSADIGWVNYEGIQADIFDHVLAMVPEFGLNVYQEPSGRDMHALLAGSVAQASVLQDADAMGAMRRKGA